MLLNISTYIQFFKKLKNVEIKHIRKKNCEFNGNVSKRKNVDVKFDELNPKVGSLMRIYNPYYGWSDQKLCNT